jgi:hypothetical protein
MFIRPDSLDVGKRYFIDSANVHVTITKANPHKHLLQFEVEEESWNHNKTHIISEEQVIRIIKDGYWQYRPR